jgi:tryptophan synthase alpha subunit
MIEIGLPFSDPLADGPTIQESSTALHNGMTTQVLDQLKTSEKQYLFGQIFQPNVAIWYRKFLQRVRCHWY